MQALGLYETNWTMQLHSPQSPDFGDMQVTLLPAPCPE
jgi:hypothetical protein